MDDPPLMKNKEYSKIAGITLKELNSLELRFVKALNFDLGIGNDEDLCLRITQYLVPPKENKSIPNDQAIFGESAISTVNQLCRWTPDSIADLVEYGHERFNASDHSVNDAAANEIEGLYHGGQGGGYGDCSYGFCSTERSYFNPVNEGHAYGIITEESYSQFGYFGSVDSDGGDTGGEQEGGHSENDYVFGRQYQEPYQPYQYQYPNESEEYDSSLQR
jgi:hypothetical protein